MINTAGEFAIDLKIVKYDSRIKKIGVLSDTHIPTRGRFLPPRLFKYFEDVQLILHAGDLVEEKIIDDLLSLAPVEAVAGNMDSLSLRKMLGRLKLIIIGEVKIGLLHGDISGRMIDHNQVSDLFKPHVLRVVVFGHLHQPQNIVQNGTLYFNPGSAVDPRRGSRPSCGRLLISDSRIGGEVLYL